MSSNILDTAKQDAVIVTKRLALKKLIGFVNQTIVTSIERNPKIKSKAKRDILEFLETDRGVAAVKFLTGLMIPQIKIVIHPDYHDAVDSVAQELRVQGELVAATEAIDFIVNQFKHFSLDTIFSPRVRVETDSQPQLLDSGLPVSRTNDSKHHQHVN